MLELAKTLQPFPDQPIGDLIRAEAIVTNVRLPRRFGDLETLPKYLQEACRYADRLSGRQGDT